MKIFENYKKNSKIARLIAFVLFCFFIETSQAFCKTQEELVTFELENGIPVFLKNCETSQINTIEVSFSFGSANLEKGQEGYLKFLLNLLTTESKKYPKNKIEKILQEKHSAIYFECNSDYSSVCFEALEKYFYEILPIFTDCVSNPSLKKFNELKTQSEYQFYNKKDIDYSLLLKESSKILSGQTNYFGKNSFTQDSISQLSKEKIKTLYQNLFSRGNVAIFGYGNFDIKKISVQLNDTIGKINLCDFEKFCSFNVEFTNGMQELKLNQKNAVDFASSFKKLPALNEKLFAACWVASLIYDDILYDVVREQNGTCYSVFSNVNFTKYPVLITSGYRISDKEKFFASMEKAKSVLKTTDFEQKTESYKNILINNIFSDVLTSKDFCALMVQGYFLGGDINFIYELEEKIESLTYTDIKLAASYLENQNEQWFYLTNSEESAQN